MPRQGAVSQSGKGGRVRHDGETRDGTRCPNVTEEVWQPTTALPPTKASRPASAQDGAALIEFAMVFVIFIVLVLGMIDFGLAINSKTQIANSGREAARMGMLGRNPDQIEARVRQMTQNLDQGALTVVAACAEPAGIPCTGDFAAGDVRNGITGDSIVVTVTYSYSVITPVPRFIGLGSSLDLTSVTEMRYE